MASLCGETYWAVGAGGTILKNAATGGFSPVTSPTTADLFAVGNGCDASSSGNCITPVHYIVGAGGVILKNTGEGPGRTRPRGPRRIFTT